MSSIPAGNILTVTGYITAAITVSGEITAAVTVSSEITSAITVSGKIGEITGERRQIWRRDRNLADIAEWRRAQA